MYNREKFDSIFTATLVILFLALFCVAFREWLFSNSILTQGDWAFYFKETMSTLRLDYFSVWLSDYSFGRVLVDVGQAPSYAMYGVFAKYFGLSYGIIERIVHLIPTLIINVFGSWFLFRRIFPENKISQLVGITTYICNTYFLDLFTGDVTLATGFAFAPLLIALFLDYLHFPTLRRAFVFALISFIATSYEPRSFYLIAFVLAVLFFSKIFFKNQNDPSISFVKYLKTVSIPAGIFILLNIYWLIGLAKAGSLVDNSLFSRSLFGNQYWNILYSFTLHHPWWTGSAVSVFQDQPIPVTFWIIPIFAFLSFLLNRKNTLVLSFTFVALVGVLLSKQVDYPFPNLYLWLYTHLPGFGAFREASKFYFFIVISYSVLLAFFVNWIWENWVTNKVLLAGRYLIVFLVLAVFFWNLRPFINGEIETLFVPREIPSDYLTFNNFIQNQNEYFRIFWAPQDSRWGTYTDLHSKVSATNIIQNGWMDLFNFPDNSNINEQIIDAMQEPYSADLFKISSIKYVVVPGQDPADDNFFNNSDGQNDLTIRTWYLNRLNQIGFLKKINIGTSDSNLVVYQNESYDPPIFAFNKLYSIDSLSNLEQGYDFIHNQLGGDLLFTVINPNNISTPTIYVHNLFENVVSNNLSENGQIIATTTETQSTVSTVFKQYVAGSNTSLSLNNNILKGGYPIQNGFLQVPVSLNIGTNTFVYDNPNYSFVNQIQNGSFEEGLWTKTVDDCDNYDKNPVLAMSLDTSDKTDGGQSVQLEAQRHFACTSTHIQVVGGQDYLLNFDYQSPNTNQASFQINFLDKDKTVINQTIQITDKNWHTYSQIITVPKDASTALITIYSKENNGVKVINRYDNFKFIQIPNIEDSYYLTTYPLQSFQNPSSVTFSLISPTKKLVHITGATTPFFLAMNESYEQNWRLEVNNGSVSGLIRSWLPFVHPDAV